MVEELAAALGALRRGSRLSSAEFEARTRLSRLRVMAIENALGTPTREILHAYLDACEPDEATRRRIRNLWEAARQVAGVVPLTASLLSAIEEADRHRRHLPESTEARTTTGLLRALVSAQDMPEPRLTVDEFKVSLTKPAWRRSLAVSQADTTLWPNPETITTVSEFVRAFLEIKNSTGLSYEALSNASKQFRYPLARSTVHALCTKEKLPASPDSVECFITICGGSKTDVEAWRTAWQRLTQQAARPMRVVIENDSDSALDDVGLTIDPRGVDEAPAVPVGAEDGGLHMARVAVRCATEVVVPRVKVRTALIMALLTLMLGLLIGAWLL